MEAASVSSWDIDVSAHQQCPHTLIRDVARACFGTGRLSPILASSTAVELAGSWRHAAFAVREVATH
eukprot:8279740-Pyramimonas_sp.AAC.1